MLDLRYDPDPILTQVCAPIVSVDAEIRDFALEMIQTMYAEEGAGLAACQVGRAIRMFVMDNLSLSTSGEPTRGVPHIFINPEFTWRSPEKTLVKEGCLSFPDRPVKIERHVAVAIRALNLDGRPFTIRFKDFEAQCVQHEVDHLDGRTIHPIT